LERSALHDRDSAVICVEGENDVSSEETDQPTMWHDTNRRSRDTNSESVGSSDDESIGTQNQDDAYKYCESLEEEFGCDFRSNRRLTCRTKH
jgi:hypothetical protein